MSSTLVLDNRSDSYENSPCDSDSNVSFASLGPESVFSVTLSKEEATPSLSEGPLLLSEEDKARQVKMEERCYGPSRANFAIDRQKIRAHKQLRLNQFILRETKASAVSREDHHIMLRQLISTAYMNDPDRKEHRNEWRQLVAAVRKEYWGASAILSLSPDPYNTVLAKLSSMMLWNHNGRRWEYVYSDEEVIARRERQENILDSLKKSKKLFL